jgi:hypothetical protein
MKGPGGPLWWRRRPERLVVRSRAPIGFRILPVAVAAGFVYYAVMWRLTRQEQTVLLVVMSLLLVGWAVKAYRTTHPPAASKTQWQLK